MSLATDTIYRNRFKSKRYTLRWYRRSSSYKVVMYEHKEIFSIGQNDTPHRTLQKWR